MDATLLAVVGTGTAVIGTGTALFVALWKVVDKRFDMAEKANREHFEAMDKRFQAAEIANHKRFEMAENANRERFEAMDKRFQAAERVNRERFDMAEMANREALRDAMDKRFEANRTSASRPWTSASRRQKTPTGERFEMAMENANRECFERHGRALRWRQKRSSDRLERFDMDGKRWTGTASSWLEKPAREGFEAMDKRFQAAEIANRERFEAMDRPRTEPARRDGPAVVGPSRNAMDQRWTDRFELREQPGKAGRPPGHAAAG